MRECLQKSSHQIVGEGHVDRYQGQMGSPTKPSQPEDMLWGDIIHTDSALDLPDVYRPIPSLTQLFAAEIHSR